MQALDQLDKKINLLLKKYAALEAENKRLVATIAANNATMEAQSAKLAALENRMVSVHLGTTVTDEQEQQHMRTQLDQVISEIDKILNTLND